MRIPGRDVDGGRMPGRLIARLWGRLGRRGYSLLFFSMLDWVYGFSLLHPPAETLQSPSLKFIRYVAPLWVWAVMWLIPAVLCLWQAWTRHDAVAFTAAIAIKVLWGTLYLVGWVVVGLDRAYVSVAVWWALAGFVAIIASWPEARSGVWTDGGRR